MQLRSSQYGTLQAMSCHASSARRLAPRRLMGVACTRWYSGVREVPRQYDTTHHALDCCSRLPQEGADHVPGCGPRVRATCAVG
jgi:hypothetical protein